MKAKWVEIAGTKLIELSYDFTKGKIKIRIPSEIEGSIIKVNFHLTMQQRRSDLIEKIIEKLKQKGAELVFLGLIKVKEEDRKKVVDKLDLTLSRKELVKEYIRKFAPKHLEKRVLTQALNNIEESNDT